MSIDKELWDMYEKELAELQEQDLKGDVEEVLTLLAPDTDFGENTLGREQIHSLLLDDGLDVLGRYGGEVFGVPESISSGYRAKVGKKIDPGDEISGPILERHFYSTPKVLIADATCWLEENSGIVDPSAGLTYQVNIDPVDGSENNAYEDTSRRWGYTLCIQRSFREEPAFFYIDDTTVINSLIEEARLEELRGAVFLLSQIEKAFSSLPPAHV